MGTKSLSKRLTIKKWCTVIDSLALLVLIITPLNWIIGILIVVVCFFIFLDIRDWNELLEEVNQVKP